MKCDGCTHAERCPAKEEHGGAKRCSAFKQLTEQEYIQTCNTEQLANIVNNMVNIKRFEFAKFLLMVCDEKECDFYQAIKWWLKQPHNYPK